MASHQVGMPRLSLSGKGRTLNATVFGGIYHLPRQKRAKGARPIASSTPARPVERSNAGIFLRKMFGEKEGYPARIATKQTYGLGVAKTGS
jgi:hypothetical protein